MNGLHRILLVSALFVLSWGSSQHAAAQDWVYVAQKGDTLWDLCLEYTNKRGCWIELGEYNQFANDRAIPVGTEIRIPRAWLLAPPIVGRAASVEGDVRYDARGNGATVPLAVGQPLLLGSRINSGQGGSAVITLGDNTQVLIRPQSEVQLDSVIISDTSGDSSKLSVPEGEVEVHVEPESNTRFQISTPSAIAAVRGTQYRVVARDVAGQSSTRSEVLTGTVDVQAGGTEVAVPSGYGVLALQGDGPGEPRQLLAAPALNQSSLVAPVPITISWQRDAQAASWQVDVYLPGTAGALLQSHTVTEPQLILDVLEEGCYRAVVRGVDADGFQGLNSELQLCVEPPPPPLEDEKKDPYWWLLAIAGAIAMILAL